MGGLSVKQITLHNGDERNQLKALKEQRMTSPKQEGILPADFGLNCSSSLGLQPAGLPYRILDLPSLLNCVS